MSCKVVWTRSAAAWNDLPIHERQRLDPPKDNLSGRSRAMAAYQTDNEIEALIRAFRYEMPQGDLPSPEEVAPIIRKAGLLEPARGIDALGRAARRGHGNGQY